MNNRDMFYQNVNQGYNNPGGFIPPSGYNINTQYQAYGPNVMPMQDNFQNNSDYDNRISKLERQVKNLDTRLQKIETINVEETNNFYTI
ncbi:MAG: hypothetical protein IJ966_05330 [Bacilli bacterium]|nr:hypothetical protein [Bacilli bacterium]